MVQGSGEGTTGIPLHRCGTGSCFGSKPVQKRSSGRAQRRGVVAGGKMSGVLSKKNKQPAFFLGVPALSKPWDFSHVAVKEMCERQREIRCEVLMARQGQLGLLCGWEGAPFGFCRACSCECKGGASTAAWSSGPSCSTGRVCRRHFCGASSLYCLHPALPPLWHSCIDGSLEDWFPPHTVQLQEHHCVFSELKSAENASIVFFFSVNFLSTIKVLIL